MSDFRVVVENVSKKFCRRLKHSLWYGVKDLGAELIGRTNEKRSLRENEFWALKDISFHLKRGETLGLVGSNGAGKTTLLRMLHGLIKPDIGRIEIRGRMQALIALGAGFNPILTGRENICVNAAVLGISKSEVDQRLESIIDFAGIEEFVDTPLQSYSSGMTVRLGFAVAAHLNPDILVVDEVLAVGDMVFQAKCLERMSQLCRDGCAVVLVSHNEEQIRRVCNKGLLLHKGQAIFHGDLNACYTKYYQLSGNGWIGEIQRAGNGTAEIRDVEFLDTHGVPQKSFRVGQAMKIRVHLIPHQEVHDPALDIGFNSNLGYVACSLSSRFGGHHLEKLDRPTVVEIYLPRLNLAPGGYRVTAILTAYDTLNIYDWRRNHWGIAIEHDSYVRGAMWMESEWRILEEGEVG